MAEVRRDALDVGDIVQRELRDELVHLEQQRERLADAAGRAEHRDLLRLDDRHRAPRGVAAAGADGGRRRGDAAASHAGRVAGGDCCV